MHLECGFESHTNNGIWRLVSKDYGNGSHSDNGDLMVPEIHIDDLTIFNPQFRLRLNLMFSSSFLALYSILIESHRELRSAAILRHYKDCPGPLSSSYILLFYITIEHHHA